MKKLFLLALTWLFLPISICCAQTENFDDYIGMYEIKDSKINYVDIGQEEVKIYTDDIEVIEGTEGNSDPYKYLLRQLSMAIQTPSEGMIDPNLSEEEIKDLQAEIENGVQFNYQDNTNTSVNSPKVIVISNVDKELTEEGHALIKLNQNVFFDLEKLESGNLKDSYFDIEYHKMKE